MIMAVPSRGRLVVISGPSGVGKTTVLRRLLETCDLPLVRSVSATTRAPRPGEADGVNYHFLTHAEFCRRRQAGEFLECFEVFGQGDWYGTLAEEVASSLNGGKWVVLGIDVKGAAAVVARNPDTITIFLRPSSLEVLEQRLRGRCTETEDSLERRLQQARAELAAAEFYDYDVINDDLDQAVQEICEILASQENE